MRRKFDQHARALKLVCLGLAVAASGCILRSTEDYTTDVRALLEGRNGDIKSCYDAELANDSAVGGEVVVSFDVAKKTGQVSNVQVDPSSTAPAALSECVAGALEGLALDPGDMAAAQATYTWRLSAG